MTHADPLILAVEDDRDYIKLININLKPSGYRVKSADNADDAIAIAESYQPDLMLLDIMLQGPRDGFDVCREVRRFSSMPIIIITALGRTDQIVKGLDIGADDYLTKPFSAQELMARIRARLRRSEPSQAPPPQGQQTIDIFEAGGLKIDFGQQRVYVDSEEKKLTPIECRLLTYLVNNEGRVVPTMNLLEHVWDFDQYDPHPLWQAMHRLRHKIEPDPRTPRYIHTRSGIGYIFALETD